MHKNRKVYLPSCLVLHPPCILEIFIVKHLDIQALRMFNQKRACETAGLYDPRRVARPSGEVSKFIKEDDVEDSRAINEVIEDTFERV
jgi:hypothetical protein